MTSRILLVDDEDRIRKILRLYLEKEGYEVEEADDGNLGYTKIMNNDYDLVLLDIMLPGMDGWEICQKARRTKDVPIIMLTARGEEENRIQGFEKGADDYIVKPFSPKEVIMRVKAMLKRTQRQDDRDARIEEDDILEIGDLVINHEAHTVTIAGQELAITPKEFDLLYFMASSPNKVFSREELLKEVWNYEYFGDLRTVDTHVKRLREKLSSISEDVEKQIATVWGVGYKFKID